MGIMDIFKSAEQKKLEGALQTYSKTDLSDDLDKLVDAYSDTGAKGLSKETVEKNKDLLKLVKSASEAKKALATGDEGGYVGAVKDVLIGFSAEVSSSTFDQAAYLAKSVTGAFQDHAPSPLQAKGLELLASRQLSYSDYLGGPYEGQAGLAHYESGLKNAFTAARCFSQSNRSSDAARVYENILQATAGDNLLKDSSLAEAKAGALRR